MIENAKIACEQSKFIIDDHFIQVGKMIEMPKNASNYNVRNHFVGADKMAQTRDSKKIINYKNTKWIWCLRPFSPRGENGSN